MLIFFGIFLFSFSYCFNSNAVDYGSIRTVIFDTDMGPDYDDVGALAILHALADSGEVNILATISSNLYENTVPCIEVINTYFNRPDLPLGRPLQGENIIDKRFSGNYWAEKLPLSYSHKIKKTVETLNAIDVYRQILSSQPDTSVTIITVGFFTNLAALLQSTPDRYSDLDGQALVRKKVKHLVSMGGKFPEGREFNVFRDSISSKKVFDEWPTDILLCGFEIGRPIYTGLRLIASDIKNSPVKDVYSMCLKKDTLGRSSWDQITVLVGVRGYERYFNTVKGRMIVAPDGSNRWKEDTRGKHEYLTFKMPKEKLTCLIENLMMHQPIQGIKRFDISGDSERQVVVAQGTDEIYQGHPTTVLLPDGKTLYCVWTYKHGGPCGPMKKSEDGGRTWSELLPVPKSWTTVRNCPTIYRLSDPKGKSRLFVFAGEGPDGSMYQACSEDEGKTWSEMKSNGFGPCVMPFCTIEPINGGKELLAMTNIRRPDEKEEERSNVIVQSISKDGGFTWSPRKIIVDIRGLKPCEPEIVRSPDGKQLLCLIRENQKRVSLYIISNDEGKTWSEIKPLPLAVHGDRHKAKYAKDGRLVIVFRDTGKESLMRNHFVAWVGKYEDLINGGQGQYKIKLLHSYKGGDCGYPGLELLPDGTFVATTYIKYREGKEQNSVVSTRFTLEEFMTACDEKNVREWSEKQIDDWYVKSEWSTILPMKPDVSINKRLFVEQNVLNPQSWAAAMRFMKESNFNKMTKGKYELSDDGTFATVTDYLTKDSAHFEAHRKYIDIQHVANGQEYILITPLDGRVEVTPYEGEKDIEFFDKDRYTRHLANRDNFLVLFPEDGHKPCIKVNGNDSVRKIVVKIPFKE
ncbi:YhcH/YjgK/YiaL family protein [Parabacteroides sp. Marseille-P3160]|uniref:YhcH/YjgK/YiaL family protein n=1 Tax=Parabacteroides sp. Marseille-P3160 TaxID=1917887 RepID=UPI001F38883B|nr:YhcH/YjgK/YiaL family protein [Parabacteroides sp. Marseille-P3160]